MKRTIFLISSLLIAGLLFYLFAPIGVLWERTYTRLDFFNPFHEETFINPAYTVWLIPHAWLPIRLGNAINLLLNVAALCLLVHYRKGKWLALALALTNPFFLDAMRVNNIDWLPALGLLCSDFGIVLLAIKPQVFGGVALYWLIDLIREKNWMGLAGWIASLIVIGTFTLVYGFWLTINPMPAIHEWWNFAPWPLLLPVGLGLLYLALKKKDQDIAACATPFLVPYLAPYSMAPYMALVASRWPKLGIALWIASWWYVVVAARRS